MFNETSGYVAMMSGFIIAPYTGDFEFYVAASDKVALFISNTTNVNDASLISSSSGPLSPDTYGEKSMSMFLEGNGLLSYSHCQFSDFSFTFVFCHFLMAKFNTA